MIPSISGAQSSTPNQISNTTFLQVLVGELQNQDPFQSQNPATFVTQMAQMSTLQSQEAVQQDIQILVQTVDLGNATALIGKNVVLDVGGNQVSGQVSAAAVDPSGNALLTINGNQYPYTDFVSTQ